MDKKDSYRPNVGIILQKNDEICVFERINEPGAFQFPQGGQDEGESQEEALFRELEEETGLKPQHVRILEKRSGYRYDFPARLNKKWKGQEQCFFRCEFLGPDDAICIDTSEPEFSSFRWIPIEQFPLSSVVDFKQETYRKIFMDFFKIKL